MGQAELSSDLRETPLAALHRELGARMVPFAGWSMPVQYPSGILAEHAWTRSAASLFDVSHMGQFVLGGPDHAAIAAALERLTPGDFAGLAPGRLRYTLLLNEDGGIIDDIMVTRSADPADERRLLLVVNAARAAADSAHIATRLPADVALRPVGDRALLALQGPKAADALARHCPQAPRLSFMTAARAGFDGIGCEISRSGYTGEDGFEIFVPASRALDVARALLAEPDVKPAGLGARDSLRLEAGLPLYGHDIDETTSPIEAGLGFAVAKRRRERGDFPGARRILREIAEGPVRRRVGLRLDGRAPAREGAEILAEGRVVGRVTSGGFGPTVGAPIAMGTVDAGHAAPGARLDISVRGKPLAATVAGLPFVPHRYVR